MKYTHQRRLQRARAAFQSAARQVAECRKENARWAKLENERTLEELAVGTAYEDLEAIAEGSVALIDAVLEGRLVAFLDTMRARNDEEDDSDPE